MFATPEYTHEVIADGHFDHLYLFTLRVSRARAPFLFAWFELITSLLQLHTYYMPICHALLLDDERESILLRLYFIIDTLMSKALSRYFKFEAAMRRPHAGANTSVTIGFCHLVAKSR